MWNPFRNFSGRPWLSDKRYRAAQRSLLQQAPIPTLWLFGKTGSGKSSIIRFLTGIDKIAIGAGFRPETRFSERYDFPDATQPLMRFLDTRGLGEVDYDPAEDIAAFGGQTQLMIVVVRAMDHAVDELVSVLRTIRRQAPRRPVILALTALHDAYPGEDHPSPDPFGQGPFPLADGVPDALQRSLALQYERFDGLFDRAAPIDLTPPAEGFQNPEFGGDRLKTAIIESLPSAYRQTILQMDEVIGPLKDLSRKRTLPYILGASTLAATAAAIPLPWLDIPVVLGLQTHLVYKLAQIHQQPIDAQTIAQVTGGLGGHVALRLGLRGALKFLPWVGMAMNATAAFASTYATGMAWNWYFTKMRAGHVPTEAELKEVFQEQLLKATDLWKSTHSPGPPA